MGLGLCREAERNQLRFALSLEPTICHDTLELSPRPRQLVVLGHSEDIGILVGPNFTVTGNGGIMVYLKYNEIVYICPGTDAILYTGPVLKDFDSSVTDDGVRCLTNLQSEFRSHHSRQLGPLVSRSHHRV